MDFRILGPLEVVGDDGPVPLGGAKQRALLAVLLLHEGETVGTDRLVDELWGESPPATATKTVQVYVSHLRRALGDGLLETQGRGYRLHAPPERFDLARFRELAAEGRQRLAAGEPRRAADALREALTLWRGPALADLAYEPFARERLPELEELRIAALEDRIEADLALGRHAELVAELQELVRAHPLRERLRGQLMLALYRSGRQAEALDCFQKGRRRLVEELGLEPGPALQELHRAILNQDPELGAPTAPRRMAPADARRRAGVLIAVGALVAAGAIAALIVVLSGGSGGSQRAVLEADTVGAVVPAHSTVSSAVRVAGGPARMASLGSTLWVGSDESRTISAVDTRSGQVTHVVAPGGFPSDLALGGGSLWVLDRDRGVVIRINTGLSRVEQRVRLGVPGQVALHDRTIADPWAIAAGAGGVWVTDGTPLLRRLDAPTGRRMRPIDAGVPLDGVLADGNGLWAISGRRAELLRIDPRSGAVRFRIPIVSRPGFESPYPISVEAGFGSIWVLNANTGTVSRVDPRMRGVTATVPVGQQHGPLRLATGDGYEWVANADGTLARIDPRTSRVTYSNVAHALNDVAVAGNRVWVSATTGSGVTPSAEVGTGAGATTPLAPAACSPVYHQTGVTPKLLIAADFPLQGSFAYNGAQTAAGVQLLMRQHHFQAGRFPVGLQVCDDTTVVQNESHDRCKANARAYSADASVVAIVGPFNSSCAFTELPILNRAPRGPLAEVSPTTTVISLTYPDPAFPGTPQDSFPTGVRSFARVVAPDDVQGIVDALEAQRLGVRRPFVVDDREPYGQFLTSVFRKVAARRGMRPVGSAHVAFDGSAASGRRPAQALRRTRPDGVYLAGFLTPAGAEFIRTVRRVLGDVPIIAPDGYFDDRVATELGVDAEGMAVSITGRPVAALGPAGRRFAARLKAASGRDPLPYSIYGAAATELVLDAIARSDGTRSSVTRALFHSHLRNSILGDYSITPTGDTSANDVAVYRIRNGRQRLEKVLTPPADLLADIRGASP